MVRVHSDESIQKTQMQAIKDHVASIRQTFEKFKRRHEDLLKQQK
jgi:hypothetical protein